MKSAGNDIVSLRLVNKQRTSQFRFYSKILSASEQILYHQPQLVNMSFENYVWLLWSVKESAYKYLKRNIPDLAFSPTKIVIQCIKPPTGSLLNECKCTHWENDKKDEIYYRGKLTYGDHSFYFRSKISKEWIATVVNDDESFDNVFWGVQLIDNATYYYQSKAAKALLADKLSSFFPGDWQVIKSAFGYPVIVNDNQDTSIPASLSHDDFFVAYSFILN